MTRSILSDEMGFEVRGHRFFSKDRRFSYPIAIVIYNGGNRLGYFDPDFYELGFHEILMRLPFGEQMNIIRHELAHYLLYLTHGPGTIAAHGPEFREFCRSYGWSEEVGRASMEIPPSDRTSVEESAPLRKIRKLMALGTGSNVFEAESAMLKARELLVKYGAEKSTLEPEEEVAFVKTVFQKKKIDAKLQAIARILQTFFVYPVFRKGTGICRLDILGSELHIKIADHVAIVLDRTFEELWLETKKDKGLQGITAKNSFFLGIAKGYCNKIAFLQRSETEDRNTLIVLEGQLEKAKQLVYPRKLGSLKTRRGFCPESARLGELAGQDLQINPGLQGNETSSETLYLS